MNKIYRFIGVLFTTAFLMAMPMLFILSMYCVWDQFIKTILVVLYISEFLLVSTELYCDDKDQK